MMDELPKFNLPPLIETALGVDFEPISGFAAPHFGLFWQVVRGEYPHSTVQPPLDSSIENFTSQREALTLTFSQIPEIRCWFYNKAEPEWLLQLQRTRFISNWRTQQNSIYPHYEITTQRFWKAWENFNEFLTVENLKPPKVLQCEVTYINHIDPLGQLTDIGAIFPSLAGIQAGKFLPQPEGLVLNLVYVIPENQGRLYLNAQPVLRHFDMRFVWQLMVTAKVLPVSSSQEAIDQAFALGRTWAVKGFADFTSESMQQKWERR
jgi:uncharacterized protein (TIGR04255 family)